MEFQWETDGVSDADTFSELSVDPYTGYTGAAGTLWPLDTDYSGGSELFVFDDVPGDMERAFPTLCPRVRF